MYEGCCACEQMAAYHAAGTPPMCRLPTLTSLPRSHGMTTMCPLTAPPPTERTSLTRALGHDLTPGSRTRRSRCPSTAAQHTGVFVWRANARLVCVWAGCGRLSRQPALVKKGAVGLVKVAVTPAHPHAQPWPPPAGSLSRCLSQAPMPLAHW